VVKTSLDAATVDSLQAMPTLAATATSPSRPISAPVAALKDVKTPTPVLSPSPAPMPPPAASGSGHRGLYMTMGALIVLAVLVLAGIYVPRISNTHAKAPDLSTRPQSADSGSQSAMQPSEPPAPAATKTPDTPAAPATSTMASVDNSSAMQPRQPAASAPTVPVPSTTAPSTAPPAPSGLTAAKPGHARAKKLMAQNGMSGDAGDARTPPPQGDSGMAAPAAANDSAQMDELEQDVDKLSNRAAAVNSGLDRLQQQQTASGYGLRGDIVERQASMKANLFKAEEAMQRKDATRTKKYVDLTDKDLEALEKFLGH
jgi:hypothetical protein